jgi:hypothetical protein
MARATKRAEGYDIPVTARDAIETAIIPSMNVLRSFRYVFRYYNASGSILPTQAWTTQMLLDEFAVSMGSGTARRIFNAIKLRRVEIWNAGGGVLGVEFSPATVAGDAGSFRIPTISSTLQVEKNKNVHIVKIPQRSDLAYKVFTSQQAVYTLFNVEIPASETILELEFDAVMWNADGSPFATAYSSSSAAGTIGLGNFQGSGMTGWRIQGWSNLATP